MNFKEKIEVISEDIRNVVGFLKSYPIPNEYEMILDEDKNEFSCLFWNPREHAIFYRDCTGSWNLLSCPANIRTKIYPRLAEFIERCISCTELLISQEKFVSSHQSIIKAIGGFECNQNK